MPCIALGGAQQYEVLSASVRATLASAVRGAAIPEIEDRETRLWIAGMARRIAPRVGDEERAKRLLRLVYYEAKRAGLDPQLVLAVIDVESRFDKYAVSRAGARGLMQVMPFWVKQIGTPGQDLFQERTNVRYGCTILRYYLDRESGNLVNALGRYNGSLGRPEYPARVVKAWRERWSDAAGFNVKR
ncbi:MAG TPA: lytic transglycosylase domain-containing protein [Usitatibacter sp.]|nr:lytic transglycosylase domain-containing protein [Usitatibacter sp.]